MMKRKNRTIELASEISKQTKKNIIIILFDMLRCNLTLKASAYDYYDFEFFNLSKEERKTYLTKGINDIFIKKNNNLESSLIFEDRNEFNKKFAEDLKRDWIYLREVKGDSFVEFLKKKRAVIVKPIDKDSKSLIEKINVNTKTDGKKLYRGLRKTNQVLVEEFIKQHPDMNSLYKNSVNTIRLITFFDGNKFTLLQAILKIGNGGIVDNYTYGGMYAFLNNSGKVITPAVSKDKKVYEKHPKTNIPILGFKVPFFKEAVNLLKEASKKVDGVAYISWDLAITEDGPLIIKGDSRPKVYQARPSLTKSKLGILSKYNKAKGLK